MTTQQRHDRDKDDDDEKELGGASSAAAGAAPDRTGTPKTPPGMKRIRLLRSIVLSGEHEDADSIHDVTLPLAQRLIGEGSAVHHLEEGQSADPQPTSVNRMEDPSNRDPKSIRISRPAPKGKPDPKDRK